MQAYNAQAAVDGAEQVIVAAAVTQAANDKQQLVAMRAKLQTAAGRALYALRKAIVEPVFGQIKGARGCWFQAPTSTTSSPSFPVPS